MTIRSPRMFNGLTNSRTKRDRLVAIAFLAPSFVIFAVFVYYALAFNVYLSATSWNFISPTKRFIGLDNFYEMFGDDRFWRIAKTTVTYAVGHVGLSMILGLGLALLLNQNLKGRTIFRTLFFFPNITTASAVALLWVWIFNPRYGLANYMLGILGIEGPHWLLHPTWALVAIIIFDTWRSLGYVMLIYLGGLLSIPSDYYEAAQIDGANRFQRFFKITLPLLSPTTFFLLVTSFINSMQVFDSVAVMTQGGPAKSTTVANYYIWQKAFLEFDAGYASAVSIVLFGFILILTIVQNLFSKRWVHYAAD